MALVVLSRPKDVCNELEFGLRKSNEKHTQLGQGDSLSLMVMWQLILIKVCPLDYNKGWITTYSLYSIKVTEN